MTEAKTVRARTLRRIATINSQLAKGRKLSSKSVQFIRDLRRRNPAAHGRVKLQQYVQGRVREAKKSAPAPVQLPEAPQRIDTYHVKRAYTPKKGNAALDFEAFSYGADGQLDLWEKVIELFMELAEAEGFPFSYTEEVEIGIQSGKFGPMVTFRGRGHIRLTKLLKDALGLKGWNYGEKKA